jgi:hypothetical protein
MPSCGSRALGRHRSGLDIDLCLEEPAKALEKLLDLGGALGDLLLLWRIDLQLRHWIDHQSLLAHVDRADVVLWQRSTAEQISGWSESCSVPPIVEPKNRFSS